MRGGGVELKDENRPEMALNVPKFGNEYRLDAHWREFHFSSNVDYHAVLMRSHTS
jgi:hypothetical protein